MDWLFQSAFNFIQSEFTLSSGIAVIVCTLAVRLILLPLGFASLKQTFANSQKMAQIKPEIEQLKDKYQTDPVKQSQCLMELYKANGISVMNKSNLINMVIQGVVGIFMFQVINGALLSGRFAWISDIAKSDVLLSVGIAFVTGLSMYFMPSTAESVNYLMMAIISVVCLISLLNVSSAVGLYWGTTSVVSLLQSMAAKFIFKNKPAIA
ncbi:membrane protein insertase YidC [Parashewanella curva]|uniref:Membrane protein insertase YidC n=1 Tax=Parashewanella curva TaxID=2338552 RepID=A0A3L8PV35_9GAMM|nr:membrane protein insertase YidC [Parashewanella curva]RLV59275.1 membrane protein insertase YidC [Parashewanella curva]